MHSNTPSLNQIYLENTTRKLFCSHIGIKNTRKELLLKHPHTGSSLEVDVWYPDLNICFEFQDVHHYKSVWYCQTTLSLVQQTDEIKKELILQQGQTFIAVPCWWDGTLASLQATISFHRPDLFLSQGPSMIPINPSPHFFSEDTQLMLVSFPNSSHIIDASKIHHWWMGEKYDGVRCCWLPNAAQLYSRHGIVIALPGNMFNLFGFISFDGEIWSGRGLFQETSILLQADMERMNWALFRVIVFDVPLQKTGASLPNHPFEQRYSLLLSSFLTDHPITVVATRFLSKSQSLNSLLLQVLSTGGEGLILQKLLSIYQIGRSLDIFKIKGTIEDQEAMVVDVNDNGSLLLQLPGGTYFTVPKGDCILPRKAVSGDIVTFTYNFASHRAFLARNPTANIVYDHDVQVGGPAQAVVYRIRSDLMWEDVLQSSSAPPVHHFIKEQHQKIKNYYGTSSYSDMKKEVRAHLEDTTRELGFANHWYSIPVHELKKNKVMCEFIDANHDWLVALVSVFPDLKLDLSKFYSHKYANNISNRRMVFEEFAKSKGGNPLDPNFWHKAKELAVKHKEINYLLRYYSGRLHNALAHLYPEMQINQKSFVKELLWDDKSKRREFFDNFATNKNLDPLNPNNWYSVASHEITSCKKGHSLMKYYSMSFVRALVDIYPEVNFLESKFMFVSKKFWLEPKNRRNWFDTFAEERSFDPLIADNWYNIAHQTITATKGGKTVLQYHSGSYRKAVSDLYPNLHLQYDKFINLPVNFWQDPKNRRQFFDKFASTQFFDPLCASKWYNIDANSVLSTKGGASVIAYHGSFMKAVVDLYPEVQFNITKFTSIPKNFWRDPTNRRKWFDMFAESMSFNPLLAHHWYSVTASSVKSTKKGGSVLDYYGGNFIKAAIDLYPELHLQKEKFSKQCHVV
eukprot:Phypoly_transcript_02130.p1 GENE.Phypoly_transcript_02130~~Phypoly_transcript_02130.p1  ORF type:complete len:911 (+),score=100.93 Phypoly_transcript_02130:69-2801(+)